MSGLACNACNKDLKDDADQRLHYKSEWHRYNLKRKVAGVPGVTEALFLARQAALAKEKSGANEAPMMYSCALCGKGYRSSKAHAEHLKSRVHMMRAAQGMGDEDEDKAIVRPIAARAKAPPVRRVEVDKKSEEGEESDGSGWESVGSDDELAEDLSDMKVDGEGANEDMDEDEEEDDGAGDGDGDDYEELDPSCCFMCDKEHKTLESCMVHLHKHHGFFVPDIEYLKDLKGLLTYIGLKVKRDFMCLYCNDRCQPFTSLEAVRKHMVAKSHCKVHYGDGDEEEEAELEDFYDYSSSYVDEAGKQLILSGETANSVELGSGGSELIITTKSNSGTSSKAIGSREFMRYYRQKPRPSPDHAAITAAVAARYKSMGLVTAARSRERMVQMKVLKEMRRSGVDAMRSKIGMKSNVIRNLPSNVPY